MDIFGKDNEIVYKNGLDIQIYENGIYNGFFIAEKGNYDYSDEGRIFYGDEDVYITNVIDSYEIYADKGQYNTLEQTASFFNNTLLEKKEIDSDGKKQVSLVYADEVKLEQEKNRVLFFSDETNEQKLRVTTTVWKEDETTPNYPSFPRTSQWVLEESSSLDYNLCTQGQYYFGEQTSNTNASTPESDGQSNKLTNSSQSSVGISQNNDLSAPSDLERDSNPPKDTLKKNILDDGSLALEETANQPFVSCVGDTLVVQKKENSEISADNIFYYPDLEYLVANGNVEIKEDNPERNNLLIAKSEKVFGHNDLDNLYFEDDIFINTETRSGKLLEQLQCEKGFYDYSISDNRLLLCVGEVQMEKPADDILISGEKLKYFIDQKYSVVLGNAELVLTPNNTAQTQTIETTPAEKFADSNQPSTPNPSSIVDPNEWSDATTTVLANSFEFFEESEILYAKGDVEIDNGSYNGKGAFANYQIKKKFMTLFGNTKLIRYDGGEFFSDIVVFDTRNNKVNFERNISGSLPF